MKLLIFDEKQNDEDLRKGRPAFHKPPALHALNIVKRVVLIITLCSVKFEKLEQIGAVFRTYRFTKHGSLIANEPERVNDKRKKISRRKPQTYWVGAPFGEEIWTKNRHTCVGLNH